MTVRSGRPLDSRARVRRRGTAPNPWPVAFGVVVEEGGGHLAAAGVVDADEGDHNALATKPTLGRGACDVGTGQVPRGEGHDRHGPGAPSQEPDYRHGPGSVPGRPGRVTGAPGGGYPRTLNERVRVALELLPA